MAAINFPNSPSVNDTFSANSLTWRWNGTVQQPIPTPGYSGSIGYSGSVGYFGSTGYAGSVGYAGSAATGGAGGNGLIFIAYNYIASGTLLSTYCSGFNLYGTYADGAGGTYNALIQVNSLSCGYVASGSSNFFNFFQFKLFI